MAIVMGVMMVTMCVVMGLQHMKGHTHRDTEKDKGTEVATNHVQGIMNP